MISMSAYGGMRWNLGKKLGECAFVFCHNVYSQLHFTYPYNLVNRLIHKDICSGQL